MGDLLTVFQTEVIARISFANVRVRARLDSVHAIAGTPGSIPRPPRNSTKKVEVGRARFSCCSPPLKRAARGDRKSTRLNSSHSQISYAVFCLKKKKKI